MARVKGALNARKKHKKVLKLARGYRGARSKQYRVAKQSVMKAMAFAFAGRKQTKREYRSLWIVRINAAARMNEISYRCALRYTSCRCCLLKILKSMKMFLQ